MECTARLHGSDGRDESGIGPVAERAWGKDHIKELIPLLPGQVMGQSSMKLKETGGKTNSVGTAPKHGMPFWLHVAMASCRAINRRHNDST